MNTYFLLSFVILAVFLFFSVSKLIWVASVRRLEKKTTSKLSESDISLQLKRARIIAILLVLIFSYLSNLSLGIHP